MKPSAPVWLKKRRDNLVSEVAEARRCERRFYQDRLAAIENHDEAVKAHEFAVKELEEFDKRHAEYI